MVREKLVECVVVCSKELRFDGRKQKIFFCFFFRKFNFVPPASNKRQKQMVQNKYQHINDLIYNMESSQKSPLLGNIADRQGELQATMRRRG